MKEHTYFNLLRSQRWRSWLEHFPHMLNVGCSISQLLKPKVSKIGSDNSTAKCSVTGASVTGPRIWPSCTVGLCHSRYDTLNNPHCSLAMSAKLYNRSKCAALHW